MASGDNYGLFWNSNNGDRTYSAESFTDWLKKFFTTGVFTGDLQVTSIGGMNIAVGTGYANLEGKVRHFTETTELALAIAHSNYTRIDNVVVEKDTTNRNITIKVITGTPSTTPVPPEVVRSGGKYQLVLARVRVEAGASAVTQSSITDTRGDSSICGYVVGAVQQIDFGQIQAQFDAYIAEEQSEFDDWFDNIKGQLDEDAAGHLQNEIDGLSADIEDVETLANNVAERIDVVEEDITAMYEESEKIHDGLVFMLSSDTSPRFISQNNFVLLKDASNNWIPRIVTSDINVGDSISAKSVQTTNFSYFHKLTRDAVGQNTSRINTLTPQVTQNTEDIATLTTNLNKVMPLIDNVKLMSTSAGSRYIHIMLSDASKYQGTALVMTSAGNLNYIQLNGASSAVHALAGNTFTVTWNALGKYTIDVLSTSTLPTIIIGGRAVNSIVTMSNNT